MQTTAAVFAVSLLVVKLATMVRRKRYKLPPGPWGLPLVGYLPFFGSEPPVTFTRMRKTYGDVISISMGSWSAVVINGRDAIREALVTKGDDFSGRPAFTTARLLNEGRNFAFSEFGAIWKMHRKIVSNVMYMFTNARTNPSEDIIRSEANTIVEEFVAHGDESFCPLVALEVASASLMYQLCYGAHTNVREDADFMKRLNGSREFQKFNRAGNPVDVMPWLRYVMPGKVTSFFRLIREGVAARIRKVEEHEATFDDKNLRDITDGLIHAGSTLSAEARAVGLDRQRVLESLDTIFGAGVSTVTSTLQWSVCLMAAHPEVQEKVFRQIDEVVGQGRAAALSDRADLPLVEATIYEVLRFSCAVPFGLPHCTTRDTTLRGYDIPEGTVVLVNLHSIFVDEELWGDPRAFRPERFLGEGGGLDRGLVEQVAAFSLGRRRCVGEFLARMELFLFFTTLLQRLRFYRPPGHPGYTLEADYGLTHDIKPFQVCVSPRE